MNNKHVIGFFLIFTGSAGTGYLLGQLTNLSHNPWYMLGLLAPGLIAIGASL